MNNAPENKLQKNKLQKNKLQKNWLEWSVFALGLVLVLGTLGYLVFDAATQGSEAARLEVRLGKTKEAGTTMMKYYAVPVTVVNTGDQTAEGVVVQVTIEKAGREIESAEFEIAFVPRRSQAEGQVIFSKDPRTSGELKPRVLGYEEP